MTTQGRDYARWHRLASENLIEVTLTEDIKPRFALEKLTLAKSYADRAKAETSTELTRLLNGFIQGAIDAARTVIENRIIEERNENE